MLLEKGRWMPLEDISHPLWGLQDQPLANGRLKVFLGPQSRYGAQLFRLVWQRPESPPELVLYGLHHQGPYPSYNWLEVVELSEATATQPEWLRQLFSHLANLIPPGGHLMVEYDSPVQRATARSLALGVPPVLTPLGYLMFQVGCGAAFKDWYIAEGWLEGPRKLQGFKPLNPEQAEELRQQMSQEVTAFMDSPLGQRRDELVAQARERAKLLLAQV